MKKNMIFKGLLLMGWTILALPVSTQAYIDPSTGSFLIQAIAGLFFAGGAGMIVFWKKIKIKTKSLLGKKRK
jgi:hypothetical protein